jgi:hypothetical protein
MTRAAQAPSGVDAEAGNTMFGRWRAAPVAIASAVLVAALAGCEADVTKEILFINDSVTSQSVGRIITEFNAVPEDNTAGRYAPNFGSSVAGIGLGQVPGTTRDPDEYWVEHLTSLLEHVNPEVIVVELGYNDCGFDLSTYGADIDNFMASLSGKPVHWLTVADARDQTECDDTINAALTEATTRWPNLTLFDFAAHMEGHPEWTVDGLHLNDDGQRAYADWLHAQLDAVYFEETPPTSEDPVEP